MEENEKLAFALLTRAIGALEQIARAYERQVAIAEARLEFERKQYIAMAGGTDGQ